MNILQKNMQTLFTVCVIYRLKKRRGEKCYKNHTNEDKTLSQICTTEPITSK